MTNFVTWAVIVAIVLVAILALLARFYERATRETSLVRTGFGGRRVAMDGGLIALAYFHEIARVNMRTLRLEVKRTGEAALITRDFLRVDVGAEFYVSVMSTEDGVARAAQTLGDRTFHADKLRELIEGKLVDAMRAVAARMTMNELHESRGVFVAEVRALLGESLARNGLEIDSVSLSALDQTPFRALDENNAFNAVGMRRLAEVIASSKKERAEIDADAEVSVHHAAMQATRRKLQIDLERQQAEIAQVQQIETLRAAQLAEVVKRKAESERQSARARIEMERDIRAAEIAKERELQEAEIARERDIVLAGHERQIALADKSQQESRARIASDAARADAVRAAEAVTTAQRVAEAEGRRQVAVLVARQESEVMATRLCMAAQAEKDAAADRARARVEDARAEADAAELRSAARQKELLAEAEGRRAIVATENGMDARVVAMRVELAKLEALPKIVAEMVKPAEKIDSIRIHHVSGLGASQTAGGTGSAAKPAVNQALDSIMEMAVQLPALRKLGEDLGLSLESGLAGVVGKAAAGTRTPPDRPGTERKEN